MCHFVVAHCEIQCVNSEVEKTFGDYMVVNLQKSYEKVFQKLINVFKEKKINVEELIKFLRLHDEGKNTVFTTDDAFSTIKTEIQLFEHVGNYCKSIYDYQALDILVQASGFSEAIKELEDFTEKLQNSVLTEIDLSEVGELLHPDDFLPGTYKFIIESVGAKCKIGTKNMVQSIVEQIIDLRKGALIFKGIDVESILFIYQISEVVKNRILQYKFTERDITFLEQNNIICLIVDDIRIMELSQPNKVISNDV